MMFDRMIPIVGLMLAFSCSDTTIDKAQGPSTPIDATVVDGGATEHVADAPTIYTDALETGMPGVDGGLDTYDTTKVDLPSEDAGPDTYTGPCEGSLGMKPECVARCAKYSVDECRASRECIVLSARRIVDGCDDGKDVAVGCHSMGCGAAFTAAQDLSGGTWLFPSTCLPEGWTPIPGGLPICKAP